MSEIKKERKPLDPNSAKSKLNEIIVKRLNRRGFGAQSAFSGRQALEILAGQAFDVMLLDIMMPGMDGIEVLREVKKHHPGVEVILLTVPQSRRGRHDRVGLRDAR